MTDDTENKYESASVPLNVRIPFDIRDSLDMRAKQLGWTRSQLVKEYIVEAILHDNRRAKLSNLRKKND
jgi:hypothetical protein